MKIAKVRYTGRKGEHNKRLPSGERLRFRRRDRSDPWVIVEEIEDARRLEDMRNYEVEWTARGRLASKDLRFSTSDTRKSVLWLLNSTCLSREPPAKRNSTRRSNR